MRRDVTVRLLLNKRGDLTGRRRARPVCHHAACDSQPADHPPVAWASGQSAS
jgi:hypothetical protein